MSSRKVLPESDNVESFVGSADVINTLGRSITPLEVGLITASFHDKVRLIKADFLLNFDPVFSAVENGWEAKDLVYNRYNRFCDSPVMDEAAERIKNSRATNLWKPKPTSGKPTKVGRDLVEARLKTIANILHPTESASLVTKEDVLVTVGTCLLERFRPVAMSDYNPNRDVSIERVVHNVDEPRMTPDMTLELVDILETVLNTRYLTPD